MPAPKQYKTDDGRQYRAYEVLVTHKVMASPDAIGYIGQLVQASWQHHGGAVVVRVATAEEMHE